MLKQNVANWDRATRLVVCLLAFYPVLIEPGIVSSLIAKGVLAVFGLVNAIAVLTGYCPVYHLTRFSTRHNEPDPRR
ncbi:MAG: DUF2892 domain-containing protein [Gammaproteobacteria bacterium]|nr:DUF2892 domain-containing protein [Gammaproteobacteria bacterium]